MKKLFTTLTFLISISTYASIPASTHLGCQLYTGEPNVFYDLRKFIISTADQNGERVLSAHLTTEEGLEGVCTDLEDGTGLICDYITSRNKKVTITLDTLSSNEIEGTVNYEGLFFDKTHQVYCDLLTYPENI